MPSGCPLDSSAPGEKSCPSSPAQLFAGPAATKDIEDNVMPSPPPLKERLFALFPFWAAYPTHPYTFSGYWL